MFGQKRQGAQDALLRTAGRVAKGEQKQQADGSGDGQRIAAGRQRFLNLRAETPAICAEFV